MFPISPTDRNRLPSYIPSESFARAYLETVLNMPLEHAGDLAAVFAPEKRHWIDPLLRFPNLIRGLVGRGLGDPSPRRTENAIVLDPGHLDCGYEALRPLVLAANGDAEKAV